MGKEKKGYLPVEQICENVIPRGKEERGPGGTTYKRKVEDLSACRDAQASKLGLYKNLVLSSFVA